MRLHAACVFALVLCAMGGATGTAQGATAALDGDTLVVTSDEASEIQFRLPDDGTPQDIVLVTTGFTSLPGCTARDANIPTRAIACPGRNKLRLNAGPGNNSVTFNSASAIDSTIPSCFESYEINLGDGNNDLRLPLTCPPDPPLSITVTGGSGNDEFFGGVQGPVAYSSGGGTDRLRGSPFDDLMNGGDGDDVLFGDGGNDQVLGVDGSDALNGGAGNDVIDGGTGDDELGFCRGCADSNDTSVGADTYVGGPGTDKLWFDNRPAGVTISLDGAANDGTDGEGDNVGADIEKILATVYADRYTGSAGADHFEGNGGADTIRGAGGNDRLYGDDEDDQVFGDAGDDQLYGGSDDDVVDGGPGADSLYGDFTLACSPSACAAGNDRLLARDGEVDRVNCGTGADTAQLDGGDLLDEDPFQLCETIDRGGSPPPPPPSPPPLPPPGDTAAPVVRAATVTPAAAPRGAARRLRLTLSEAAVITRKIARVAAGRRVRGFCVAPTRVNRRKPLCKRALPVAGTTKTISVAAGPVVLALATKVNARILQRGTYRVTVTARDTAGNVSREVTAEFRVI